MIAIMPESMAEISAGRPNMFSVIRPQLLRNHRVFVTGGSGFFGRAVLEWLAGANRHLETPSKAVVLTRDCDRFRRRLPHLACEPWLELQLGDVRTVTAPTSPCSLLVHLAGEPHGPRYGSNPSEMIAAMVDGARHMLDISRALGVRRVLLVSTGAIYGPQPQHPMIPETAIPADEPTPSRRAYALGKRQVEELYLEAREIDVVIARPFAFLGPGLSREENFAASQFLNQSLSGGPIHVMHGNVTRSYLYSTDLAEWLWTLLLLGVSGEAYNVGSEIPVTMAQLARLFAAQVQPEPAVLIAEDGNVDSYVPSTRKIREAFGLQETVGLEDAVRATCAWHRGTTDAAQHNS